MKRSMWASHKRFIVVLGLGALLLAAMALLLLVTNTQPRATVALDALRQAAGSSATMPHVISVEVRGLSCGKAVSEDSKTLTVCVGSAALVLPNRPEMLRFTTPSPMSNATAIVKVTGQGDNTVLRVDHSDSAKTHASQHGMEVLGQPVRLPDDATAISVDWEGSENMAPLSVHVVDKQYRFSISTGSVPPSDMTIVAGALDSSIAVSNALISTGVSSRDATAASKAALEDLQQLTHLERWQQFLQSSDLDASKQTSLDELARFLHMQLERMLGPDFSSGIGLSASSAVGTAFAVRLGPERAKERWLVTFFDEQGAFIWEGQLVPAEGVDASDLLCKFIPRGQVCSPIDVATTPPADD